MYFSENSVASNDPVKDRRVGERNILSVLICDKERFGFLANLEILLRNDLEMTTVLGSID